MKDLHDGLRNLREIRALSGIALIRSGVWIHQSLPLPSGNVETFRALLVEMFQTYANEGKLVERAAFGGEDLWFLILNRQTALLVMTFPDPSEIDLIERSGQGFLRQFASEIDLAPPEPNPVYEEAEPVSNVSEEAWIQFRTHLERTLSKSLGTAQAKGLIDRQLGDRSPPSREAFPSFAMTALDQVKDRQIRGLLQLEVEAMLRDIETL